MPILRSWRLSGIFAACGVGGVSIGKYVARSATYFPMDTQPANRIWPPTQPRHYTTRGKNTTKSSAPEDGQKVARNMLSNL